MSKQTDNATAASENTSAKRPTRRQFAIARQVSTTRPANQRQFLTASATTIHDEGDGIGSDRFPDSSIISGNPSTE